MKAKAIFCLLFLGLFMTSMNAYERAPKAISPGSDESTVTVAQSCPTFSWTAVDWAEGYRVAVFDVVAAGVLPYEEMEALSSPVLRKEIDGRAFSWTPSSDERLIVGREYVWYVHAVDVYGQGEWSDGRMFKVDVAFSLDGVGENVRKKLQEQHLSEEAIEDVLENIKSGVRDVIAYGVDTQELNNITDNRMRIQDLEGEGDYNTFFGKNAGFSTTGYFNSFFGKAAGFSTSSGESNTFVGYQAGYNNTGSHNSFLGDWAGYNNTTGSSNTFMGWAAGRNNTTGYSNTFIGLYAGRNNTTGGGNVFLGVRAGYNETASNKLYIDNSDTSSPLIWGDFSSDIVAINGQFGVGTHSPGYPMELERTGTNASIIVDRTDGAMNYINATASFANFGSVRSHPLRLVVNSLWTMRLDSDGSLTMRSGATCTAGGEWQNASSRELKENIRDLTAEEAAEALEGLSPVRFNYKADKEEESLGFIAEEVPNLVATKDRKGMSAMDVVAVLTKVVQEQQETISELKNRIAKLEKR